MPRAQDGNPKKSSLGDVNQKKSELENYGQKKSGLEEQFSKLTVQTVKPAAKDSLKPPGFDINPKATLNGQRKPPQSTKTPQRPANR
ncbi:MAG: hypothetical protein M1821_004702 [Bathelium mastoideum]|nr:MAG: hypothetical protein M1821_004702 [Bathelium mastoideum]